MSVKIIICHHALFTFSSTLSEPSRPCGLYAVLVLFISCLVTALEAFEIIQIKSSDFQYTDICTQATLTSAYHKYKMYIHEYPSITSWGGLGGNAPDIQQCPSISIDQGPPHHGRILIQAGCHATSFWRFIAVRTLPFHICTRPRYPDTLVT